MRFVQILEMSTSNFDEVDKLHEKWLKDSEGQRTVVKETICRDRDNPDRYVIIVEFPSYEDAMKNNDLPATAEIAEGMQKVLSEPATFRNLDVIRED
jgi:hypothetical protein